MYSRLINLIEKELGLGFTNSFVTGKEIFFFLKNIIRVNSILQMYYHFYRSCFRRIYVLKA